MAEHLKIIAIEKRNTRCTSYHHRETGKYKIPWSKLQIFQSTSLNGKMSLEHLLFTSLPTDKQLEFTIKTYPHSIMV